MRKLLAEYLLEPEVFWNQRWGSLPWQKKVGVPLVMVTFLALVIGVGGGLQVGLYGWTWEESLQRGLRWFTLGWFVLVFLMVGSAAVIAVYLHLFGLDHPRGGKAAWAEGIWAMLPLWFVILPFLGVLVGWVGLLTLGAWIYVRYRPSWFLALRMVGVLIMVVGGGMWAVWDTIQRFATFALWTLLGR